MRILVASLLAASAVLALPAAPADAAGNCLSGAPLLVPILASSHAKGTFQWSSECSSVNGSWAGNALGGSFTFTNPGGSSNITGTWSTSGSTGSFTYAACAFCTTWQGTWTTTSTGGTLQYTCFGCGDVSGSWTTFGSTAGSFHYGCSGCDPTYGNWNSSGFGGAMTLLCSTCSTTSATWSWESALPTPTPSPRPSPTPTPAPACVSSTGPGIPPPRDLATGIPGLHAAWYGQSGYPTLCAGDRATVTIPYLNTGSVGWLVAAGQTAYLGTWEPEPGQDRPSPLGGDGTLGSPATGWPSYGRPAIQPASYVAPGQVAWFQFAVQAPMTPGTYRLAVRPVIEGTTWLEDYGVFLSVTVRSR